MKCRLMYLKVAKISNFWYIFVQKGYIPLSDFYKSWRGGGSPEPHPRAKFHHCSFKNVALQPQNRQK